MEPSLEISKCFLGRCLDHSNSLKPNPSIPWAINGEVQNMCTVHVPACAHSQLTRSDILNSASYHRCLQHRLQSTCNISAGPDSQSHSMTLPHDFCWCFSDWFWNGQQVTRLGLRCVRWTVHRDRETTVGPKAPRVLKSKSGERSCPPKAKPISGNSTPRVDSKAVLKWEE